MRVRCMHACAHADKQPHTCGHGMHAVRVLLLTAAVSVCHRRCCPRHLPHSCLHHPNQLLQAQQSQYTQGDQDQRRAQPQREGVAATKLVHFHILGVGSYRDNKRRLFSAMLLY
jgi:hypothetical protein